MATVTAAILIVGNEVLSDSTQDANVAFIAQRLAARGITLSEVRVVRDEEDAIINALNALRTQYRYVFTTGGIGPTHDDITSECISKAFGLPHEVHAEARKILEAYYAPRGIEINPARLRMATMPKGALLLENPVSGAPGFRIGNVFVMAGVPKIMQMMFAFAEATLEEGPPLQSRALRCNLKEGDIAAELDAIQKRFPEVDIGSYPAMSQKPSLTFALRSADSAKLEAAALQVDALIRAHGEEPQ